MVDTGFILTYVVLGSIDFLIILILIFYAGITEIERNSEYEIARFEGLLK